MRGSKFILRVSLKHLVYLYGMSQIFLLALVSLSATVLTAQDELYSNTYGKPSDPAVIFLHGSPGLDSYGFEVTTAEKLSERGLFVIVYDRRGEGRSIEVPASYTFEQSSFDIDSLFGIYGIQSATLLGQGFGGVIGTKFAEAYPERVRSLILTGAPVSLSASLQHILDRSREIYLAGNDTVNLGHLDRIEAMDTTSMIYRGYTLTHAINNGFLRPASPSSMASNYYDQLTHYRDAMALPANLDKAASKGFLNAERYNPLDLTDNLMRLIKDGTPVYGIYGMEDGLYSLAEIRRIEKIIGLERFHRIGNASHNVFIDQQPTFLTLVEAWAR